MSETRAFVPTKCKCCERPYAQPVKVGQHQRAFTQLLDEYVVRRDAASLDPAGWSALEAESRERLESFVAGHQPVESGQRDECEHGIAMDDECALCLREDNEWLSGHAPDSGAEFYDAETGEPMESGQQKPREVMPSDDCEVAPATSPASASAGAGGQQNQQGDERRNPTHVRLYQGGAVHEVRGASADDTYLLWCERTVPVCIGRERMTHTGPATCRQCGKHKQSWSERHAKM